MNVCYSICFDFRVSCRTCYLRMACEADSGQCDVLDPLCDSTLTINSDHDDKSSVERSCVVTASTADYTEWNVYSVIPSQSMDSQSVIEQNHVFCPGDDLKPNITFDPNGMSLYINCVPALLV